MGLEPTTSCSHYFGTAEISKPGDTKCLSEPLEVSDGVIGVMAGGGGCGVNALRDSQLTPSGDQCVSMFTVCVLQVICVYSRCNLIS